MSEQRRDRLQRGIMIVHASRKHGVAGEDATSSGFRPFTSGHGIISLVANLAREKPHDDLCGLFRDEV